MATHSITGGPSKWDLVLALFDGDSAHRRKVVFKINSRCEQKNLPLSALPDPGSVCGVIINEISREDGSGENWNFSGWYSRSLDSSQSLSGELKGYYSTTSRTGWINLVSTVKK